jgi:hypothetical protein
VTRYSWAALRRLWKEDGDLDRFGKGIDTDRRPLVLVANGTHAAYPRSCRRHPGGHCRSGGVPHVPLTRALTDKRHNGGKPWRGNDGAACRSVCLQALPTRSKGAEPARWNAFGGRCGSSNCVLGVFCSSAQPPRSPGVQARYKRPWCRSDEIDIAGGEFVRRRGRCEDHVPSAQEVLANEQLVAVGDSFSSGEGAGGCDPATDRPDNSCHRSRAAWPHRLAVRLRLSLLRSLAGSGAVTGDLTDGRPRSEEPERRVSQISRIRPTPASSRSRSVGTTAASSRCCASASSATASGSTTSRPATCSRHAWRGCASGCPESTARFAPRRPVQG